MKNKMRLVLGISLATACAGWAGEEVKTASLEQALLGTPAAELPAKAAELVKGAKTLDQSFITVEVVKSAIRLNPVSGTAVVSAIARAVPEMASIAAATAAEEQSERAAEMAKAAAAAAPTRAGVIVTAVCQVAPKQYRQIAIAAADAAPGSSPEVLHSVAAVFPDLRNGIEHTLANVKGVPPAVPRVLEANRDPGLPEPRLPSIAKSPISASAAPGPAVSSPVFAGPPPPPPNPPPNPPPPPRRHGGRNYAAP